MRASGVSSSSAGCWCSPGCSPCGAGRTPSRSFVNRHHQAQLTSAYEERVTSVRVKPAPAKPRAEVLAVYYRRSAVAYRAKTGVGDPIGRLLVPRIGLRVMVVLGTDTESLKKGPGAAPAHRVPRAGPALVRRGAQDHVRGALLHIDKLRPGDRSRSRSPTGPSAMSSPATGSSAPTSSRCCSRAAARRSRSRPAGHVSSPAIATSPTPSSSASCPLPARRPRASRRPDTALPTGPWPGRRSCRPTSRPPSV